MAAGCFCRHHQITEHSPWHTKSSKWPTSAIPPGMAWANSFLATSRWRSGGNRREWAGTSMNPRCASSPMAPATWAAFIPSRSRRCFIAPIPNLRCQWCPSATRWCSRRKCWSSTAISRNTRGMSSRRLACSKGDASSGRWPVADWEAPLRARIRSTTTCCWRRPVMARWQR